MSTLFEKTHLIHDPSNTEFNNHLFDDLRSRFAELATPYVAGALSEQYADSAAHTLVEEAEIVLTDLLSLEEVVTEYDSRDTLLENLSKLLAQEPLPSDEEVSVISKSLSTAIISAWVTGLHSFCKKSFDKLRLFGPLLDQGYCIDFNSALAPFPITMDTLHAVFPELLAELPVNDAGLIDLPLGLYLEPRKSIQGNPPIYFYVGLKGKHAPTPKPIMPDFSKKESTSYFVGMRTAVRALENEAITNTVFTSHALIAQEVLKRNWKHLLIEASRAHNTVVLEKGIPEGVRGFFESTAKEINQTYCLLLAEEKYNPVQPQVLKEAVETAVENLSEEGVVMVSKGCYVLSDDDVTIMTHRAGLKDLHLKSRSDVCLATMFNQAKL